MALIRKRRLTHQQTRRIEQQQTDRQDHLQDGDAPVLEGIIVAHYGRQLEVKVLSLPTEPLAPPEILDGEPVPFWRPIVLGEVWRCHVRTNLPILVTGDRVRWQANSTTDLGIITALHPRTSLLTRPDRYHHVKPVAANISLIVVMFAPLPVPSPQLIDRYLVACHQAQIPALLVLNKSDLLQPDDALLTLLEDYTKLHYETLVLFATGNLDPLKQRLQGEMVVFVGQSGVGKSSIINQLMPHALQRVNQISDNSALGQHTTTTTRLLPFDEQDITQGALIDSPGIREFGVWHLSVEAIRDGFIEMQPFYGHCRFRNCLHQNEPHCALKLAAERGDILPRRLQSLNRLEEEARSQDALPR